MPRVPAEGPLDARIMVLGESPGNNEWKKGKPFIGQSGDLMNDVFRACGQRRQDIYITNVIKDHLPPFVPALKRKFFFDGKNPSKVYMDGILDVVKEIQEVRPHVVFALGNFALWAMMQHEGIMKWRGSVLESTLVVDPETGQGQKLVPALHPAYYINARNQWHQLPLLEWDFARAVRESASPQIIRPNPTIIVDPAPAELEMAALRFAEADLLTCDTEWYGPNKLAYVGFADSKDFSVVIPANNMQRLRVIREILTSGVPIVMQNAAFDIPALYRQGIEVVNLRHDTMVAWNCCWADLRKKGLSMICSLLTDEPYYKDEVEFVGQDDTLGQIYCGKDCVVTHEGMEKILAEEFPTTGGQKGYDITMSAMPYFLEAAQSGMLVDNERRLAMKEAHIEIANNLEDALSKTIGYSINCRSSKQVIELVFDKLLPMYKIKRTKRTSKQDYLMDIAGSTDIVPVQEILGAIIRVRQNRKIVSSYLHDGILDTDGRVRTNWNLAGTRSGRFSSTIPWWPGLALQTVPEDARVIFIPDPGHIFIGFDYEQAEARVVAVLTYNHDLLDDMDAGRDIHTMLAAQLPFGKTYEELVAECEAFEAQGKSKDECRPRYIAKKSRHAFNYVEGADTFALHVNREWIDTKIGLSRGEARKIRADYLELNPGLEPWWLQVRRTMYDQGYMDNSFGRRRTVTGRITEDLIREYVSYYPQSTIADLCTQAIVKCAEAMPWAETKLHMHDGGMFQVPIDRLDESYETMMSLVEWPIRVGNDYITIPAGGKVGYSWGEMGKHGA